MNDSIHIYTSAVQAMSPEICIVFAIIFAALWNLFQPRQKTLTAAVCIGMQALACILLAQQFNIPRQLLFPPGLFTIDKLTVAFSLLACIVGIIVTFMTMGYEHRFGSNRGEYYSILLCAVLAVMLLAGTTDLIMLFVSLETLTICCVLLSGFSKRDRKSNEASIKYLLSTAATTATFLYGLSFLYGITGSTNYYEIAPRVAIIATSPSLILILLIVLLLSVIGFKLSMVPFHMWTPDVYEGAPTPVSAFLSVGSKMGGFVVAIRLLTVVFHSAAGDWAPILGILAIASMVMGNLIALAQTSLKRMLAYSSIAHVGYLLIGLTANSKEGLAALVFYLIVYGFMNLGAFTAAILVENEIGTDNIDEISGLVRKRPWVATGLAICLLNLAGLPVPPAGFLAKVFIFYAGVQMYSPLGYWLVGIALLTSVPAVFYYSRVVIMMFVREPSERVASLPERRRVLASQPQGGLVFALTLSLIGIVVATFNVMPLMNFSTEAVTSLGQSPSVGTVPREVQ